MLLQHGIFLTVFYINYSYQINNEVFVLEETFFLYLFFSLDSKTYRLSHFLNAKDKAAQSCQLKTHFRYSLNFLVTLHKISKNNDS